MPNKLASQDDCLQSMWVRLPDNLLLAIFNYLAPRTVLLASQVCQRWNCVALDEMLWRDLFYEHFHISRSIPKMPGSLSWKSEFKRLSFHTPCVESEVISLHTDQVLHVSFAHNGELFATTSKDGFINVWNMTFPCTLRFTADMKEYKWKYTQFSQFNSNDTLLLVSGVHFGSHSTSGEIAVFHLDDGFQQCRRVINKPYDIFGAWYNNDYFLSGNLLWRGNFSSMSDLILNKSSLERQSQKESLDRSLYKFLNQNASSIRTILVAQCPVKQSEELEQEQSSVRDAAESQCDLESSSDSDFAIPTCREDVIDGGIALSIECTEGPPDDLENDDEQPRYSENFRTHVSDNADLKPIITDRRLSMNCPGRSDSRDDEFSDKYLIFTMGEKTYTPHQIGIKRIAAADAESFVDGMRHGFITIPPAANNDNSIEQPIDVFDNIDRSIELHGHIIGMCLSPDHRFLYVNSRTWPQGYVITDPLSPPPISQEIDVHVIDLETFSEVGSPLRSHKAYTPNDECFFIFLDVSQLYIASGAEDRHGYLWDRHYGIRLRTFEHTDVVNCVAFNPQDPEVLVTVSDDKSIKIWRSQNRELEVKRLSKISKSE